MKSNLPRESEFTRSIVTFILHLGFYLFVLFWSTLGLFLWGSMLLRTMLGLTLVVFAALLNGKDISERINVVIRVARIWPHGFIAAHQAFILEEKLNPRKSPSGYLETISILVLEIVWAMFVYGWIIGLLFFYDAILAFFQEAFR